MLRWFWTILFGFVAGFIAKALTPSGGASSYSLIGSIGVVGAIVATFIAEIDGWNSDPARLVASVIGAVVPVLIYDFVARRA
jgi:uncharacterized membrane protein YeaQ/YmgE (transglycosylase-associated protein family)